MIRVQDAGEVVYGGIVTLSEWWDDTRIRDGTLLEKDIWKKYSFWSYLGIGLTSTLISAMGWMPRQKLWTEHVSHGFLYDFPRFIRGIVVSMGEPTGKNSRSNAIKEAQEVLRRSQERAKELAAGKPTDRSYQHEFEGAGAY